MHRRVKHRHAIWLAPFVGALAIAAFPAAASAAPPAAALCATPTPTTGIPCYTAVPSYTPTGEAPTEGRILTGTVGTWGGAQPVTTNTTQWERCTGSPTPTCTQVSTARTYTIQSADVGSTLEFIVTATNGAGSVVYTETVGLVAAGTPLDRSAPSASGLAEDGQTLTASPGIWAGSAPITYQYQWKRCPANGTTATCGAAFTALSASPTYTIQDVDVGHTLCVVVQATNNAGPGGTPVSVLQGCLNPTAVVTPANTGPPSIGGVMQQGKTLTESHGSWLPGTPSGYSYQWQQCDASGANCGAIPGANSQTYTLTPSDVGHTINVQESAIAGGVTSTPATSGATPVIQGPAAVKPPVVTPPVVTPGNNGNNGGNANNNPSANISSAQIRGLLARTLAPQGKAARIRALLKNGGYVFSFAAPSPGRLVISWYQVKHGKQTLVAVLTVTFQKTGAQKVKLVLTGKGRKLLKGKGKLNLTAIGGFTPKGHGTVSMTKGITLKS